MWRTRVGYAGGTTADPTYHSIGDHSECFQVDYDPTAIGYEDLLELFWQSHDPTRRAWKTQYASLVLAHDDGQLEAAAASARRFGELYGKSPATRIEPLESFYLAEDYHQKYYLRGERLLMDEFRYLFASEEDIVDSPAAAVVNGYLYGVGTCARLERDLPELGLSEQAGRVLRRHCR